MSTESSPGPPRYYRDSDLIGAGQGAGSWGQDCPARTRPPRRPALSTTRFTDPRPDGVAPAGPVDTLVLGDINLTTGAWVNTHYREQVLLSVALHGQTAAVPVSICRPVAVTQPCTQAPMTSMPNPLPRGLRSCQRPPGRRTADTGVEVGEAPGNGAAVDRCGVGPSRGSDLSAPPQQYLGIDQILP